ncbi:hypothetical protein LSAT2_020005 [Lamellibrachia satsuma]|nr:hypothetical protein LSAT2_020005 [Lamellibrachia satsuma]
MHTCVHTRLHTRILHRVTFETGKLNLEDNRNLPSLQHWRQLQGKEGRGSRPAKVCSIHRTPRNYPSVYHLLHGKL